MTIRLLCIILASIALSACAPTPLRGGVVYDQASDAVRQAATARKADEAADKALMPPLTVEMPKNAEAEPRFDLSVVNAQAAQVFMALVTGTPYNMLVTPEVSGQITIRLKDVTVKEALEAIRELYGYEFTIKGNRITIQPNTLQTRMFQVNYLASKRQGSSEVRVTSGASSSSGGAALPMAPTGSSAPVPPGAANNSNANLTSRVQTTTDNDFWGPLTTALTTLIGTGEGRSVVVSPQSGVIVVRALPSELRSVENYLKATQTVVERQVILEAKIIDVTLSQDYQSGVNWAAFKSGPNSQSVAGVSGATTTLRATSSSGGAQSMASSDTSIVTPGKFGSVVAQSLGKGFFGLAFQTANFAALLNFLETQGSVSVLSSPRIATINNQKAVLKVGTDDLFVTNVTTTVTQSTVGAAPIVTPSVTLQSYFSGISLDVTPQIDEDNNIILHIHPAVSVVTEKTKNLDLGNAGGTLTLPLASSSVNETDSIIRAKDGNIVAIGGLMRQEQDVNNTGLPGASAMGTAGALFGQRGNTLTKRELVILLKPTVISDDSDWGHDIDQSSARLRDLDPIQFGVGK
ncbi:MAG: secretin N-terminal domain-containing protein [Rhodocyclaceae bacterium]|nr:secretin N-terminal domain-containing protein [Rhodocyclaceae bacterium]